MISLAEAYDKLLGLASPPQHEECGCEAALGRVLAAPLISKRTQPAADLSAMDGFAISSQNLTGPWKIIGESAAGRPFYAAITPDETVRIFTGALVPQGADAVIMQEDVERSATAIHLKPEVTLRPQQHVRTMGSDFSAGQELIAAGETLTAAAIGLAIAAGHARVSVSKPVHIAILATGDELIPPGQIPEIGQIPSSNDVMLSALLSRPGVKCTRLGLVPDDELAIQSAINSAEDADLLITIGGASVGDHDLVRPALLSSGASLDFWRVAMRPGKPVMAGTRGKQIILGLPGNPVSAYVTALIFARPLIAKMLGSATVFPKTKESRLIGHLPANGIRQDFVRARFVSGGVSPIGSNDSAALLALSNSDCLILRLPNAEAARDGDQVEILPIA